MVHQGGVPLNDILHPRPNPIIAAMYTLRDLDVDVIIMHGPAGCGFMASRRLEEAGVRVITTGMQENDLIFGAEDKLARILKKVEEDFRPKLVGIVGTCASMIIGENLDGAIKKAGLRAKVIPVDTHGCSGPNTSGAIRTLEVAAERGIISNEEFLRQKEMLVRATLIEKDRGITSKQYLEPHPGVTKLTVALRIVDALRQGKRVAVVLNAKKETAYGFADIMRAMEEARSKLGGEVVHIGNLDPDVGLPRIRRYARNILRDLEAANVKVVELTGGLDEYPVAAEKASMLLQQGGYDLRIIAGLPHHLTGLRKDDVLVTDQPRELRNYIQNGFELSVGEVTTHADVMRTDKVIRNELGNTIREVAEKGYR
ncbi:MAG: Ni-sirohydrochlorin a,c-diamide reductive cyclase catalytic subunit [Methanomassiliicoccales archaeon]|nr:MAG: Ni-sirohydrochlorin a,c-diamide reductive cyclase catalytic subunit [Methanomassiliicoccales archaeon]